MNRSASNSRPQWRRGMKNNSNKSRRREWQVNELVSHAPRGNASSRRSASPVGRDAERPLGRDDAERRHETNEIENGWPRMTRGKGAASETCPFAGSQTNHGGLHGNDCR